MTAQKTVLVTGCSAGGIGSALALALAKQGHAVFATARNPTKIPPELAEHPGVTTLELDVTSAASVADAASAVAAATQERSARGLDVLVNNAGAGYTIPVLDMDLDAARRVYETNVWGPVRMVQAFADLLVESRGRVVNVSTVGAVVNTPWISAYASSKAALTNISETMRLELAPFGVSVVTIMVGVVASNFRANEPVPVLPPNSRYAAIKDTITRWAKGEAGPKGGSAEELAQSLVDDIVGKDKRGQIWKGHYSGAIKFASKWAPASMLDRMMTNGQGLDELSKSLAK